MRFVKPEWDQYAVYAAWAGSGVRGALHARTVARDRRLLPPAQRALRRHRQRQRRSSSSASSSRVNYLSVRQNKRWDLTKNQQFTLSDQTVKLLQEPRLRRCKFLVFDKTDGFDRFRSALDEYKYQSPSKVDGRVHRRRQEAGRGASVPGARATAPSSSSTGPHRARDTRRTNRTSPTDS